MFRQDSAFQWRPGRQYFGAQAFTGIIGASGVSVGVHTGAPVQQEISTFGIASILLDTAGDMLVTDGPIPYDLDPAKDIKVRVVWTSGSADVTDTVTWLVTYKSIEPNVTALATPGTALDKVIAAQDVPVATAYALCKTEWGVIKAGTISDNAEHWIWNVEMDAFDAGLSEDKFLIGLEIAYTPRRLREGSGMLNPAEFPVRALSKQYAA